MSKGYSLATTVDRKVEIESKRIEKLNQIKYTEGSVDEYNEYIEEIQNLHKNSNAKHSWKKILNEIPSKSKIEKAQKEYEEFKPSFINKIFNNEDKKRNKLKEEVEKAKNKYNNYVKKLEIEQELARGVIEGNEVSMLKAIEKYGPLDDLLYYITDFNISIHSSELLEIELNADIAGVVPNEIRSLTKSGKVSIKNMSNAKFNELTQDYISSLNIRIALDIFALLPTVQEVQITTSTTKLNTSNGHYYEGIILKVTIDRETLDSMNINGIDPSDAIDITFKGKSKYTKSKGYSIISSNIEGEFVEG